MLSFEFSTSIVLSLQLGQQFGKSSILTIFQELHHDLSPTVHHGTLTGITNTLEFFIELTRSSEPPVIWCYTGCAHRTVSYACGRQPWVARQFQLRPHRGIAQQEQWQVRNDYITKSTRPSLFSTCNIENVGWPGDEATSRCKDFMVVPSNTQQVCRTSYFEEEKKLELASRSTGSHLRSILLSVFTMFA